MERYEMKFKKESGAKKVMREGIKVGKRSYKAVVYTDVYEDDYNQGEGDHVNFFDQTFTGKDLKKVLNDVADWVNAKSISELGMDNMNDYEWASELWYDTLVDENNYAVSDRDNKIKLWKRGEYQLYTQRHQILVSSVGESPVSEQELLQVGVGRL